MPAADDPLEGSRIEELPEDLGHPRGTLAIVIIFGLLFLLGWLAMYFFMFLKRGAPHP
jgi:hypothetical protein